MSTSSTDAPSLPAKYARTATRVSLVAVVIYALAKVVTLAFMLDIRFLSNPADPIFATLLAALGLSWIAFGSMYYYTSRKSKQFSETYTELLPEDDTHYNSFKNGVKQSKKHALRAAVAICTGLLLTGTALWYGAKILA